MKRQKTRAQRETKRATSRDNIVAALFVNQIRLLVRTPNHRDYCQSYVVETMNDPPGMFSPLIRCILFALVTRRESLRAMTGDNSRMSKGNE